MPALKITQIPVLNDNYVYVAECPETGDLGVVDPAVSDAVLAAVGRNKSKIRAILNTHHHGDHVGGNIDIKHQTDCLIYGAAADERRIPGLDVAVKEGDTVEIGKCKGVVLDVPGHTSGHIAYYFKDSKALFCGDTLFALGCGRLFEGTAEQMWTSLKKLRMVPDDTLIYCAHEYTNANADFALHVDPKNTALQARAEDVQAKREAGKPTVPSKMAEEKATNPFLRCDDAAFLKAAGLTGVGAVSAFAEIRERKDRF